MRQPSLVEHTTALIRANGLDPGSLEENRCGRLTAGQARWLRGRGVALLAIGIACIAVGVWGLRDPAESDRFGALTSLVLGFVLIALRHSDFGRSWATEIAAGRVASVEGFVRVKSLNGDSHTSYWYQIEGREFGTTVDGATAIDAGLRYRVYCLPDSDILVNIEALGPALTGGGGQVPVLSEDEVAAIVGEPMRCDVHASHVGTGAWPGAVVAGFASQASGLHVGVKFLLGPKAGPIDTIRSRLLARAPGARTVPGLGDEATYAGGQLITRRGDVLISVDLMNLEDPASVFASEQSFDTARRIAVLALQKLK
jgi:hypothetical protein